MTREGHCPGQDLRTWKPEDIHFSPCPACGAEIEFWKDERMRRCRACGAEVPNPKHDEGCAEWCGHRNECRGN
jgi:hypothetical protein